MNTDTAPKLKLSRVELFELTGYVQHKAQVRWLTKNGWKFELDHHSRPVVDRRYYDSRMGHNKESAVDIEPDFGALYA